MRIYFLNKHQLRGGGVEFCFVAKKSKEITQKVGQFYVI